MSRRPTVIRRGATAVAFVAVVAVAGCSSGAAGPSSVPSAPGSTSSETSALVAPQGFGSVTLVVTRPDGTVEEWCVWLADDAARRARGLMEVTDPELGGADAMVFSFAEDTSGSFWMRGTPLPLSIACCDGDGRFVSSADMDPCPDDTADAACPRYGPGGVYRSAVEVPVGQLQSLGLVEGSTIQLGDDCTAAA